MSYPAKRSEDRMGHAKTSKDKFQDIDKIEFSGTINVPNASKAWSEIANYCWSAYLNSPLRKYFTETDFAFAWMTCEAVDVAYKRGSATAMVAAESMMRNALFNEADRRRARIEVTRKGVGEDTGNPEVNKNVADFNERRRASGR